MFSPEDQQIEICLLKSNLEKIGDDLLVHNSALPALDAENEQKRRETMSALNVARSLNAERERLNLENVKLTAKRMQLKKQCEDITKSVDNAREKRTHLAHSLQQEEEEMELLIRKYEDSLREKADRFRRTRSFYDENEIRAELEKVNSAIKELEDEVKKRERVVEGLTAHLESLSADVPENLLVLLGKSELEAQMQSVTSKHDALQEKRNQLISSKK